jgi:uncharacterized protein (TIGR02452 family)
VRVLSQGSIILGMILNTESKNKMRNKVKKIAEETMEAIKDQKYKTSSGRTISLDKLIEPAVRRSKLYKPGEPAFSGCLDPDAGSTFTARFAAVENPKPRISVIRESTLEAAQRLADDNPCVLNFASAKHPGGGFMQGALAQEESIARSSALYHTLIVHPQMYEENKLSQKNNIGLYLDYAIYSPKVPVIRNDRGDWLDEPYTTSVVTSPAPNRGAIFCDPNAPDVGTKERSEFFMGMEEKIVETMRKRMNQVLKIMIVEGHRTIVLGAWGCGVFGNIPLVVAQLFKDALDEHPYFDNIVFAIYDAPDSETYLAFEEIFGER